MKHLSPPEIGFALTLLAATASGQNLIKNGSFEAPAIEGRVSSQKGGNPSISGIDTTWTHLQTMEQSGKVSVGLTNEIARTGKQSIYVQFDDAQRMRETFLMSDLVPIKAAEKYRVSLWGRTDEKRPLTLDQGRPYQVLEVEFFPADQASRIGDTKFRTQMIPGMQGRLLFISSQWSEYSAEFVAPADAEFMKLTFMWEAPKQEGPASGIIYFDDAAIVGPAGTSVSSLDPPTPKEEAASPEPSPSNVSK